jgi:hypothetical protein
VVEDVQLFHVQSRKISSSLPKAVKRRVCVLYGQCQVCGFGAVQEQRSWPPPSGGTVRDT